MSAIASLITRPAPGFPAGNAAPRAAVDLLGAVELLRDLVAPVAEGALGELHDVALVHQRHVLAAELHGVADGAVDEALGAEAAERLQPDADLDADVAVRRADRLELRLPLAGGRLGAEPDVPERLRKLLLQEIEDLLRVGRPGGPLDARVDVLGVLAEDHHVDLLGMLHRRRHALEPAHRPQAHVQIQQLTKRDVERADAAADRRRQRTLDADVVLPEGVDGLVGQPGVELLEALFAGVDFLPRNLPLPAERFLDGGVQHAHAGAPDVGTGAVAFDERDDRIVRHDELSVLARDGCAHKVLGQVTMPAAEDFRERCGKLCGKRLAFTPL